MNEQPAAPIEPGRGRRRPLRYAIRLAGFSAPVLLIVLLAYGVISNSPDTRVDDNLARGQAVSAPPFKLAVLLRGTLGPALTPALDSTLSDRQLALEELRGTPVVLNIWASWCVPCADEAPLLERTWRAQGRPQGVLFLGLDMQDVTSDATGFLRQFRIDYLNIRDPTNEVPRSYGATAVPETFFIDRKGRIVGHVIGETSAAQLRDGIAASLSGAVVAARRGGQLRPAR